MRRWSRATGTAALAGLVWGSGLLGSPAAGREPEDASGEFARGRRKAQAILRGCDDPEAVSGYALLSERRSPEGVKVVDVKLLVGGLSDGKHGVHIHEAGSCQPCSAAGGHFDPGRTGDPAPDGNHPYHMGDLVNVNVKRGFGRMQTVTSRVTLSEGNLSVFDANGSAIVIHADPDTYCPAGPDGQPLPGCAGGARSACGVLERVERD